MEKPQFVISMLILILCGLTLFLVVTREPRTPTEAPQKDEETARVLIRLEDQLAVVKASVERLSTSLRTDVVGRIRALETKVESVERALTPEPDDGITPTSGPRRIEISRPPRIGDGDN